MPVPSLITDLSTTISSNSPAGSENVGTSMDDYIRALSAFIAQLNSLKANLASPTFTGTVTVPLLTSTGAIGASGNISSAGVLSGASVTASGAITGATHSLTAQPSFYAYNGAATGNSFSQVIVCFTEQHDTTNAHNTSTGRFVCPAAGRYLFIGGGNLGSAASTTVNSNMYIRVNGTLIYNISAFSIPAGQQAQHTTSAILNLAASDYVELFGVGSTTTGTVTISSAYFSGYQLG